MELENFTHKIEELNSIELRDQDVIDRLKSLGINFEYSINSDGKFVYTFNNVVEAGHASYWLDAGGAKIIYKALHFGKDKFEDPGSKEEIRPNDLLKYLSEKYPEAEKIIFSSCNPDSAKKSFGNMSDKIVFIGNGTGTYSTWYSEREKKVSSVRNTIK